jgi:uncharacterized protein YjiS (DUF1127 family)
MTTASMTPTDTAIQRRPASFLGGLAQWNDARLTRRALRRLSRHELSDIGLDDPETLIRR